MIFEGLKLAVLGMGVVFIFLLLLIFLIKVSSKLLIPYTNQEIDDMSELVSDDRSLIAVITAAISAFRAERGK